uniref:Uncharacterized protein n=1 Tax=Strix occidentalis caurina TaxID=311401 RepID=A0A8D0KQG9_STROC
MYRKHANLGTTHPTGFKLMKLFLGDVNTAYLIISVIVVGLDSLHQLCKGSLILPVGDSFSSFRASI